MGLAIDIRRLVRTLRTHPGAIAPGSASALGTTGDGKGSPGVERAPRSRRAVNELMDALLPATDAEARRESDETRAQVVERGSRLPSDPSVHASPASLVNADDTEVAPHLARVTELVESLGLGYHLGGAVERIARGAAGGREGVAQLREAIWMIERYVAVAEERPLGADLHAATTRLARTGDMVAEIQALTRSLAHDAASTPIADPPDPSIPPAAGDARTDASQRAPSGSLARELTRMAVQSLILVTTLVAAVLALTLIGDWR